MPLIGSYRAPIAKFIYQNSNKMESLIQPECLTMAVLTEGTAVLDINGQQLPVTAPSLLCLCQNDTVTMLSQGGDENPISLQIFSCLPSFFNSNLTLQSLMENDPVSEDDEIDRLLLLPFVRHSRQFAGVMEIPAHAFPRYMEWMNGLEAEYQKDGDPQRPGHVLRYFIQLLYLTDSLYSRFSGNGFEMPAFSSLPPAERMIAYIHANYPGHIDVETLADIIEQSRTSVNIQFHRQLGSTAMDFISRYRIKIAASLLIHTSLRLNEVSPACGIRHESYFIRQFEKVMGLAPTAYRYAYRRKRHSKRDI